MTSSTEKNAKIPGHDEDYDDDDEINLVENSKMMEQKQQQQQQQQPHTQHQQHDDVIVVVDDDNNINNDHDEKQEQQQEEDKDKTITNNNTLLSETENHNKQQKVEFSATSFDNEDEQPFEDAKQHHFDEKEEEESQQQPQQQESQQMKPHEDQTDTTGSTTILNTNTKTSTDDDESTSTASGSVQQQQQQQQVRRHRHRPDYNDMVERELEDMMMLNSPSNTSKGGGTSTESTVSGLDSADAIRNYGASILAMADNSRATRQQEKFRRSSSSRTTANSTTSSGRRSFGGGLTSRTNDNSMISQSLRHLTITSDKEDYSKNKKKEQKEQNTFATTTTTTSTNNSKPTIVKLPPPPPTPKQEEQQQQQHQQADDDDTVSSQFFMTPAGSRDQDSQLSDDTTNNNNNGMVSAARSMDSTMLGSTTGTSQKVQQQEQRRHSSSTTTKDNDHDTTGIRRFKVTVNQETLDSIRREQANMERQRQYQEEAAEVARGLTRRVIDGAGTWFENRKERKRRADMERKMEEANRALEEMRRYSTKETAQMIQRRSNDDITRQKDEEEFNVIVVDEPEYKLRTSPPILSKDIMKEFAIKYLPIAVQMGKWKRLYSLSRDGDSFETFINNVSKHSKTLLVVKTTKEDIIGSYVETSWEVTHQHQEAAKFYGSGQSFLFTIVPIDTEDTVNEDDVSFAPPIVNDVSKDSNTNGCSSSTTINTQEEETNNKKQQQQQQKRRIVVYKWTGLNRYIQLCDGSRKLIALGGGGNRGTFGLCLEDDFSVGSSGPCETFGNTKPLSSEETFDILDLEVWGIFSYAF